MGSNLRLIAIVSLVKLLAIGQMYINNFKCFTGGAVVSPPLIPLLI